MERAVQWLINRHAAGLPLRPGGRKTSITLEAFCRLREQRRVDTMLIIAPLRVCRQTWRQEAAKWEQFRGLKFSLLHGDKKDERLKDDADIWLINPEGCDWLSKKYFGRTAPFDIVCIDELTKFKNSQAKRSKALRPRLKGVKYRWGLTGSLAPNGYMDLFGQMLMLDDGAALGKYITHFRDQYFTVGFDGFSYDLMPGAAKRIVDRISPYWFKMDESDYAQLPPLVPDPIEIELSPASRKIYDRMKKAMIAELPEGIITAANSAACYSKLSQMANGAVYIGDDKQTVSVIHEQKIEALDVLVDELNGEPVLIAYEFNHDLERIREWHRTRFGVELPYLGKGTTAKQEDQWIREWNEGKLPCLAAHPASAGHGLNMQGASAANVCWFSITWDFELWDQLIRRIRRDGTLATQIFNHMLVVKGTIDELKLAALGDKDLTQSGLIRALNYEILRDAETQGTGVSGPQDGDSTMKLSRPGAALAAQQSENQQGGDAPRAAPKGWGKPAAGESAGHEDTSEQRERIQDRVNGGDANRTAFSEQTQENARQISRGDEVHRDPVSEPEAPKTRRRKPAEGAEPRDDQRGQATADVDALKTMVGDLVAKAGTAYLRMEAVKVASAFKDSFEQTEDMFALADEILAYATKDNPF
jgi:hypothetical protein